MKTVPTVYELRKAGWKVKVGHHRNLHKFDTNTGQKSGKTNVLLSEYKDNTEGYFISANGGKTTVYIKEPDTDLEFFGVSECSTSERYNNSYGLKKALARALAEYSNYTKK